MRPIAIPTSPVSTGSSEDLLTVAESAALLRTPVATLRYWRHLRTGPSSFRLGKRVLYRRGDIEEWIASERRRQNAEPDDFGGDAANLRQQTVVTSTRTARDEL